MKDFCIVGSGISGSNIANHLSKKYKVEIFEKAKGLGGRASNRRYLKKLSFDHGLQYLTAKTKEFNRFLIRLEGEKILKVWKGHHLNLDLKKRNNLTKYIGKNANNDISKSLLKRKNIKINKFVSIKSINFKLGYWEITLGNNRKINFKNVILTCPYAQSKNLSKKYLKKEIEKLNVKMTPNITVMLVYKSNKQPPISSISFNDKILRWAANENSKKRFTSKLNLWTLQSDSTWAKKVINKYKNNRISVMNLIINRFLKFTGFQKSKIIFKNIHGWKYAYNNKPTKIKSYYSRQYKLGICGDWFLGPKAENAWLSSEDLFKKIKKNPV